jgi:predicted site-specific integrase-resolvase
MLGQQGSIRTENPAMRVAIYARVSTADQDCDRQVRELRAFASA